MVHSPGFFHYKIILIISYLATQKKFKKFGNFRSLGVNMTKICLVFFYQNRQSFETAKLEEKLKIKKPPTVPPQWIIFKWPNFAP